MNRALLLNPKAFKKSSKSSKKESARGSRATSTTSAHGLTSFLNDGTDDASRAVTYSSNTPDRNVGPSAPTSPKTNPSRFDAKTLLSPKKGKGSRDSPAVIVDDDEDDAESSANGSSMLERLHRVEVRTNPLYGKRRKLAQLDGNEDEDDCGSVEGVE